jgi:hypothetical protein
MVTTDQLCERSQFSCGQAYTDGYRRKEYTAISEPSVTVHTGRRVYATDSVETLHNRYVRKSYGFVPP